MSTPKVVLWRPMYDQAGHGLFERAGAAVTVVDSTDPAEVEKELGDASALWVRTPERVSAEMLDAAPGLVTVCTSGFGTDNVDIPAATERGILVVHHRGFGRVPVAEHTLMLLLAVMNRLTWSDRATRDGSGWNARSGFDFFELEGKTVGILGLGYIGAELARKLEYDPATLNQFCFAIGVAIRRRSGRRAMLIHRASPFRRRASANRKPERDGRICAIIGAKPLARMPRYALRAFA